MYYWQCERFKIQDSRLYYNFSKEYFYRCPGTAIIAVAGPGMIRKGNNCNEIKVKKVESNVKVKV